MTGNDAQRRQAVWLALVVWSISGALYLLLIIASETAVTLELGLRLACLFAMGFLLSFIPHSAAGWSWGRPVIALVVAMTGAVLMAAVLLTVADMLTAGLLGALFRPGNRGPGFVVNAIGFVWLYGMLATMFIAQQSTLAARAREVELSAAQARAAEAETLATTARLSALRYQLNPHFLFNTLNSLSSLVITDRSAEADAMLHKLSDFLRATLITDTDGLVPLEQEFAMLETYLAIERERFGDRLHAELVCPAELGEVRVPSFITQPLVENAIKYAVAPIRRPVTIRAAARMSPLGLEISIEDDGNPAKAAATATGTGLGLTNVRERLQVLYGDAAGMVAGTTPDGGYRVVLAIPAGRP